MTATLSAPAKKIRPTEGEADPKAFVGAKSNTTETTSDAPLNPITVSAIINSVAAKYLGTLDPDSAPHPMRIEAELLRLTNNELTTVNSSLERRDQHMLLKTLLPGQVAQILATVHRVVRLIPSYEKDMVPNDKDPLLIYRPQNGIYLRSNDAIAAAAAKYSNGGVQFHKDLAAALRVHAPHMRHGTTSEWAAVANGDYHRKTGEMHPFSPERVFLSRVPVAYFKDAKNPTIHNDEDGTDWDVDSGILAIANGDEGTERLLWEVLAAVAQPSVRTNKAVALYNPVGNNGKGTILQLVRGLAGESNTLSASVATLGKDTTLPLLGGKSLIVSDENATNDFVKNAETIKLLATRDSYFVNPKFQQPYNETFEGNLVHCLNALPRFGDHSDSMWRRWLFIPLTAEFEGIERTYIRDDYLKRDEVLQYVLCRALNMKFTGFSKIQATVDLMNEAKLYNDAARQFWDEYEDKFVWDLLPLELLYELFKAWFMRNKPSGHVADRASFDESIRSAVKDSDGTWTDLGARAPKKASVHMLGKEPLVTEYNLDIKWCGTIKKDKQFRDVIFRDRKAFVRARANAAVVAAAPGVPAPPTKDPKLTLEVLEFELLVAKDVALWERRAIEDDGVTDPAHVSAHAYVRRLGHGCGGCKITPQHAYAADVISFSHDLDVTLLAVRHELAG